MSVCGYHQLPATRLPSALPLPIAFLFGLVQQGAGRFRQWCGGIERPWVPLFLPKLWGQIVVYLRWEKSEVRKCKKWKV